MAARRPWPWACGGSVRKRGCSAPVMSNIVLRGLSFPAWLRSSMTTVSPSCRDNSIFVCSLIPARRRGPESWSRSSFLKDRNGSVLTITCSMESIRLIPTWCWRSHRLRPAWFSVCWMNWRLSLTRTLPALSGWPWLLIQAGFVLPMRAGLPFSAQRGCLRQVSTQRISTG